MTQPEPDVVYGMFSGGHDSLCSTDVASRMDRFAGALHIHTGIGIPETREYVRDVCRDRGWSLVELESDRRYEDLVLERGGFPHGTQSHNSMLYYLKQQPLRRFVRGLPGLIGLVTGIRREESIRRMGAGISVPIRRDRRMLWISPLLDWTRIDCGRYMHERSLPRNPVVDLLHRSGECLCGALARPEEIHELAQWFPDVAERINALEHECERRGIAASVWAGREGQSVNAAQEALFSKAELAPLCTSCEANA
jgi:3'-phosphoadenosine 5'-phosphosulfate sulfotransferase (PAPS reductase)/FAD synthetase